MLRNLLFTLVHRQFLDDVRSGCIIQRLYSTNRGSDDQGYVPRRVLKRRKFLSNESPNFHQTEVSENDKYGRKAKVEAMLDEMKTDSNSIQDDLEQFSSDIIDAQKAEEKEKQEKLLRPKVNPETKSFTLFPGQGSQFVGMGKLLLPFPGVKGIYDQASEILQYDLLKLCLYGPQSELDKTVYCQPAVFVTSIAAIERLKEENFQGIENTIGTAGFSVGEYAAMVFAGMMSFEDALKVVNVRAQAMQRASEETPSGMMTVFTFWGTELSLAMKAAKQHCIDHHGIENPVCGIANYLFPEVKVIAGHQQALEFIGQNYKDFGIRRCKRVPVSGAFHTSLMESAKKPVRDTLRKIEIHRPKFPVYSNVTFKKINTDPKYFYKTITDQIVKPVRWEQIMTGLYTRDKTLDKFPFTYECGPGNQLGIFLEKMNSKAHTNYRRIMV